MLDLLRKIFSSPVRSYVIVACAVVALIVGWLTNDLAWLKMVVAIAGGLPVFVAALRSTLRGRISIETFNAFALAAALVVGEYTSAVFIVLMLACADILESYTEARAHKAIEELVKLKPQRATVERDGRLMECAVEKVVLGDVVVIRQGERVPVDGVILSGEASFNESSVTGESALAEKREGDAVLSGTLNETGAVKIRATAVGKDSTIERMAALIEEAMQNKSQAERVADRFATIFLPVVALLGIGTYLVTKSVTMVIALFLVACADDMAVAIPLAMTAALGQAARRGVIVKGGARLYAAGAITTVVLDKTGTLTYGKLDVASVEVRDGFNEETMLRLAGIAEKFSSQPMGRAIFARALQDASTLPDPESFEEKKGAGVVAVCEGRKVLLGTKIFLEENEVEVGGGSSATPHSAPLTPTLSLEKERGQLQTLADLKLFSHSRERMPDRAGEGGRLSDASTQVFMSIDGAFAGLLHLADVSRPEAAQSIGAMLRAGVRRVIMLTGDVEPVAARMSEQLGITEFRAHLKPEDKLRAVEELMRADGKEVVAVVGDGVNDAPALARADVGIAMGGGMAVSVEAADIVILTDNLLRLPEIIQLGRQTKSVIQGDVIIWVTTNLLGFALVFAGLLNPATAAFYNFATDFLPLLNSARLFRR